jgi:hypothetical protein
MSKIVDTSKLLDNDIVEREIAQQRKQRAAPALTPEAVAAVYAVPDSVLWNADVEADLVARAPTEFAAWVPPRGAALYGADAAAQKLHQEETLGAMIAGAASRFAGWLSGRDLTPSADGTLSIRQPWLALGLVSGWFAGKLMQFATFCILRGAK